MTLGWPEPVRVDTGNGYADYYALPGIPIPRCPDPKNPGCLMHDAQQDTLIRDVIHAISHKFGRCPRVHIDKRLQSVAHHESTWHMGSQGQAHARKATPGQQNPPYPASYNTCNTRSTATGGGSTDKDRDQGQDQTCQYRWPGRADGRSRACQAYRSRKGLPRQSAARYIRDLQLERPERPRRRVHRPREGNTEVCAAREMAEEAIGDWNSRCEPPWSDEELANKLDSIYANGHDADDWGKFLDDDYDDDPEELRPWVNSKDLGTIIRIYLGNHLDTGEPKAVAEDSKLYRLYLDVRAEPREPKVVKRWCKSILPAPLRAAWWRKWQLGLQLYRNFGTAKQPTYTSSSIPYLTHNGVLCTYHTKEDEEGNRKAVHLPLCKFDARIIAAMIVTLGESTTIEYRIRASKPLGNGESEYQEIVVPASEFAAMNWPVEHSAVTGRSGPVEVPRIVYARQSNYCRARMGLSVTLSTTTPAGSAGKGRTTTCTAAVQSVRTGPPERPPGPASWWTSAEPYHYTPLPDPPTGNQLTHDVQATLHLRNLGWTGRPNARGIAAALVAMPWRTVLGACNFAVVLTGGSGGGKRARTPRLVLPPPEPPVKTTEKLHARVPSAAPWRPRRPQCHGRWSTGPPRLRKCSVACTSCVSWYQSAGRVRRIW